MNRTFALAVPLALLVACANPEADFEAARSADSVQAYNEFIEQHPDHALTARARQRIMELEEQAAWEDARRADDAAAYEEFLARHPQSERAPEAERRVAELRAEERWQALRGSDDAAALERFADEFPESREAQQARQRLAELRQPEPEPEPQPEPEPAVAEAPEGDFQVQLAALSNEDAAERELERVESRLADLLGEVELRVEPPAAGSRWYRLRTDGLEREEADSLCAELQAEGQACLVVARE